MFLHWETKSWKQNHVYKLLGWASWYNFISWYNALFWEITNHWICKSLRNSSEVFDRHSDVCFCTEKPLLQLVCLKKKHVYKIPDWYNVLFWERTNHWICKSLRNSCEVFVRHSNACFCTEKVFATNLPGHKIMFIRYQVDTMCSFEIELITGFAKVCEIIFKATVALLHSDICSSNCLNRLCAHCMLQSILSISQDVRKNAYPWFTLDS